jgi:bacteriochlorophyll C12 methyltransferase
LDENFGHFEDYTNQIIELLHRFRFNWNPMTRVETLHKNYERWKAHGLRGASIGLESLNQDSLDAAKKGNDLTKGRELLEWMRRDRMLVQTFYIIGFEQDTEESIRRNIRELKQYHIDSPQIQILTPQPETILFKYIERTYGITTYDYSKYDTTNLVWNHPNISPHRLQELMFWANDELFTATNSWRTATKVAGQAIGNVLTRGWRGFALPPVWSGNIDTLAVPLRELITYGSRARANGR